MLLSTALCSCVVTGLQPSGTSAQACEPAMENWIDMSSWASPVEEASDCLEITLMQLPGAVLQRRITRQRSNITDEIDQITYTTNATSIVGHVPNASVRVQEEEVPERVATAPTPQGRVIGFMVWLFVLMIFSYLAYVVLRAHCGGDEHELREQINAGLCFVGLSLSFLAYGIVQEYIMTKKYRGQSFPSPEALILCNRLMTIFASGLVLLCTEKPCITRASWWAAIPAVSVVVGSACQYRSLEFITFPAHVGMKSAIIVPTMICSSLFLRLRHTVLDYLFASAITALVIGFNVVMAGSEDEAVNSNMVFGVLLMAAYLICEATTSVGEKLIFENFKDFDAVQMMMAEAIFSAVYSSFVVLTTPGFYAVFDFIIRHPFIIWHIIGLAFFSTSGQFFIYYTIRRHGPVAFAIMMTLKQVFAMMLSSAIYSHDMPVIAYLLSIAAFLVLLIKHVMKAISRPPERNDADIAAG